MFHLTGSIDPAATANEQDVARAKHALATLGLFNGPIDGISENGLFEALKSFQRATGLVPDGVMRPGGPTARTLGLLLAQGGVGHSTPGRRMANAEAVSSVNTVATVNVAVGANVAVVVNAAAVAAAAVYVPVLGRGRR